MKKVNVKDVVFWVIFTLILVVTELIYINGTANAIEETVVETEETEVTRWVCGDYANAEMKAKRFANELHTGHVNSEILFIEQIDYNDEYEVCYLDIDACMVRGVYFGN